MSAFSLGEWAEELDAALTAAEKAAEPDPEVLAAVHRMLDRQKAAKEKG